MALDPEELKRRRAQRDAQRAKQQAKRRRTLIKTALAVLALIACSILIFVLARPGKKATEKPNASTKEPSGKTTVIHFAAGGDLNVTDTVVASGDANQDYHQTFQDVAHLLADADIAALNFEGVLCGEPYGSSKSAPRSMMDALSDAGVDLIQLANSYAIYEGMSGLATTIENVRSAGMEPLGVYENNAAFEQGKGYTICQVEGVKIAFVAFTKGMDGMALPTGSENCVNVLYTDYSSTYRQVDTQGICAVLDAAKAESPDIIIALLHWGSEFNDTISSSQEEILDLLRENGVDAAIGTHSHYVQKMELKDGMFTAISLGDFLGDAQRAGSEYSVILDLEITKNNETGETKITNFTYTPIFTVAEKGKPLRVVRIAEAIQAYENGYIDRVSEQTYTAMKYALERIEARIQGES